MNLVKAFRILLLAALGGLLLACSRGPETGPVEVKWDRDTCDRCRMVLSDRFHAAQIRSGPDRKVYKFDDIGGAMLWLEDQPWKDDPATEIWVTDRRDGRWIDGRSATYVDGDVTPMEFGIGAQAEPVEGGMSYQQARQLVLERERRYNAPGANLEEHAHEHH
ncbi:hypothetical protein QVG61_02410 [Thiohalobacter sp. IOR34]|uniref:hypothetical protein n=1 Tax=Thiohalobacter sp. IOR34 TaxID=3057176 RepID=UPI0025AF2070|nr:hypothetical protein [Thiohalobacter sp. IOR34]WJW75962.1 hypothetical protein QVG61_02410 [Thiohalobacter sp. IOR34]